MLLKTFHTGAINPHTRVAQKLADEVVFRRFQDKKNRVILNPPHPSDF